MAIVKGLVRNITRSKPFSDGDLETAHNAANTFIEGLEADIDKTYAVRIASAYYAAGGVGVHVVIVEYSYMEDVPTVEL